VPAQNFDVIIAWERGVAVRGHPIRFDAVLAVGLDDG